MTVFLLDGCGAGGKLSTSQGSDQAQETLTIANGSQLTLACGQSVALVAQYGSKVVPSAVWSEAPSAGNISLSGIYTAPSAVSSISQVTLTASDPLTKQAASIVITIVNPIPAITAVSPAILTPGATTTVVVSGSGFTPTTTIAVDGNAMPTTYASPNSLKFQISPPQWAAGTSAATALNLQPGGGPSNSITLSYQQNAISYNAATRFLQQATWGATPAMIRHVQEIGFSAFLDEQLASPAQSNVVDDDSGHFIEAFWAQVGYNDSTQLRTKTAWAWYKLFNSPGTSTQWILSSVPEIVNRDTFANYKAILTDISFNMEMGMYLSYCCGDSAGAEPNENFGREVMQLFTIGPHQLNPDGTPIVGADGALQPSYGADDIKGIARAVTGLSYPYDVWNYSDPKGLTKMVPGNPRDHDQGPKTILGQTIPGGQDVATDLRNTIDILVNQPNTGVHLSSYLIHEFVTSNPSPEYVARVAKVWANNGAGLSGDISAVVKAILLDPEARAGDDSTSSAPMEFGRFRDTVNFGAAFMRLLCAMPSCQIAPGVLFDLSKHSHEMTFYAPSVFGYYSDNFTIPNTSVLAPEMQLYSTDTIAARANTIYNTLYIPPGFYPFANVIDWSQWTPLAAGNGSQLIDLINHVAFHGDMSSSLYQALQQNLENIPATDPLERVKQTLYLAVISPEFAVER